MMRPHNTHRAVARPSAQPWLSPLRALLRARLRALLLAGVLGAAITVPAWATVYNMPRKALRAQFPGVTIRRKAVYLSRGERARLERQLGFRLAGRFHTFYIARRGARTVGYGIFDTHRVRTKDQTLFVTFHADGRIRHVEVISFFEPQEYLAPPRWLRLFVGKHHGLRPGIDLPAISGATMTTNAVSRTIHKVLLLRRLHFGKE